MTQDLNKNICGIEYNLLNLPTKVSFSDGSIITYAYSANGDKLSADYNLSLMNVMNGTTGSAQASSGVKLHRDYCGNFIYEDGALKMMLIDGGYVTFGKEDNREYYSTIICVSDKDGKIGYTYIIPIPGTTSESKPITNFKGHAVAATVHTHGAYTYDKTNSLNTCDYFSGQVDYDRNGKFVKRKDDELKFVHTPNGKSNDIGSANNTGITVYVVTPSGSLQKYEPKFAKRSVVSTQLPSDKNDPFRLNDRGIYLYGRNMNTFSCMNNIFRLMLNPMKLKRK